MEKDLEEEKKVRFVCVACPSPLHLPSSPLIKCVAFPMQKGAAAQKRVHELDKLGHDAEALRQDRANFQKQQRTYEEMVTLAEQRAAASSDEHARLDVEGEGMEAVLRRHERDRAKQELKRNFRGFRCYNDAVMEKFKKYRPPGSTATHTAGSEPKKAFYEAIDKMLLDYYKIDPLNATPGSVVTLPADSPMHSEGWRLGVMAGEETVKVGALFCSDVEEAKRENRFPVSWSSYEKHRRELKKKPGASSSAASTTTPSNEVSLQERYQILQEVNAKLQVQVEALNEQLEEAQTNAGKRIRTA